MSSRPKLWSSPVLRCPSTGRGAALAAALFWLMLPATASLAEDAGTASAEAGSTPEAKAADPLDELIEQAINITRRRYLTAGVHTPWQIMHGVLGLREDFQVKVDDRKVPALEWLAANPKHRGEPWWQTTETGGRPHPFTTPYVFEGHSGQFLAILSMAGLPLEHQLEADGGTITIADLVKHAQQSIRVGEEPTWTLWALSHYLGTEAEWQNDQGDAWSIERLVRSQFYEKTSEAACGGTHGMFALGYALRQHRKAGHRPSGVWLEAEFKVRQHIETARELQNEDGSFSGKYFQGPGVEADLNKRLGTSGHVLEFLAISLPDERLTEDWVHRAAVKVATDLVSSSTEPLKCGPMYHALDGLRIYRERLKALAASGKVAASAE